MVHLGAGCKQHPCSWQKNPCNVFAVPRASVGNHLRGRRWVHDGFLDERYGSVLLQAEVNLGRTHGDAHLALFVVAAWRHRGEVMVNVHNGRSIATGSTRRAFVCDVDDDVFLVRILFLLHPEKVEEVLGRSIERAQSQSIRGLDGLENFPRARTPRGPHTHMGVPFAVPPQLLLKRCVTLFRHNHAQPIPTRQLGSVPP
mmetsp:Transcript_3197/g.7894  ORF Transcript_3197/g.7894 Transcript_3197/m.7894 type:complete len:200 (+) Transcript_3197:794-1393(+)